MIEGIRIEKLKTHPDERGFFREVFRFVSAYEDIPVGQLSHSRVKLGVIKGWHGHVYQDQWNYVVTGKIRVALLDNRETSKTYMQSMEFIVGDDNNPLAYYFPKGVLHAYQCIEGPMNIMYVTSGVYDLEDEVRIDLDMFADIYNFNEEK